MQNIHAILKRIVVFCWDVFIAASYSFVATDAIRRSESNCLVKFEMADKLLIKNLLNAITEKTSIVIQHQLKFQQPMKETTIQLRR